MTFDELLELLAEQFSCDEADLSDETELIELGADHEDYIELSWGLGEAIDSEIPVSDLENCATIGDIYRLIQDIEEES